MTADLAGPDADRPAQPGGLARLVRPIGWQEGACDDSLIIVLPTDAAHTHQGFPLA